ncbi:MAG TPA: TRAP transporter TatT component family protein [Gammaproteobacteria bacterium]|nr:TRAP transporter TatT component family protein [Gammaproteobacteria bacterium]
MARLLGFGIVAMGASGVAGCASLIGSMAADTLTSSILNQSDPALIQDGMPAYLLLVDGFIHESPDNEDLLAAGAQIYALYGSRFSTDSDAAVRLTRKARDYGSRAICEVHDPACAWQSLAYDEFVERLAGVDTKQIEYLYAFALGWLSYLDATSEDLSAVAELPWVEAALERALVLNEAYAQGAIHTWLGIIKSLRPPALGGEPEIARAHFERSLELSGGRDLSVRVEYARRYARLMYEQELHDRLLREVLAAPAVEDGYTLFNVLAKEDAEALLASSTEYF